MKFALALTALLPLPPKPHAGKAPNASPIGTTKLVVTASGGVLMTATPRMTAGTSPTTATSGGCGRRTTTPTRSPAKTSMTTGTALVTTRPTPTPTPTATATGSG